jgi:hypothetical protein
MLKPSKLLNSLTTIRKFKKNKEGSFPPSKMVVVHIYKEEGGFFLFSYEKIPTLCIIVNF